MNKNPYTEKNEQAAEHLRLTISLLSKHQIPLSPLNYRMGYDYIAGKNEAFKKTLDEVMAKNQKPVTDCLWDTYNQFYSQDDKTLDLIREELKKIIVNIQGDLDRSGSNLSGYTKRLEQFSIILASESSPEAITTEVNKVIQETRTTEQAQKLLENQLSFITTEMESLRKELAQVKEESMIDSLTGIANRKAFDATLEKSIHTALETKLPYSLLLLDLDHFKDVNDNYGHLVGDKVLRFAASTLKCCIKGQDMAARFGGEEFAVILPGTSLIGAHTVAEQIREAISSGTLQDTQNNEKYGKITISIGVTQFNDDDFPHTLIKRADEALYLAKENGRNRVEKSLQIQPRSA